MTRRLPLDGIENFRDFGDYAAGERRLKSGLLYRSGHHARASDSDLQALEKLGFSVIVDLRRSNEREREPSRRWDAFAAEVIDNDIGQDGIDEWYAFLEASDLSPRSFRDYMLDYYEKAPFVARHVDLYRRYFQALAGSEGPVLVHCAAGKDRTGILCALTHHVAGVADDDIVADYLATNDPARFAARADGFRQHIQETTGRAVSDEAMHVAMGVEPAYLEMAFHVMRDRHGSIDSYLDETLGLDAGVRGRIHDRLLD